MSFSPSAFLFTRYLITHQSLVKLQNNFCFLVLVQIVAYSSLATCNIFSDSYPNLCCLQNTVQEASPPTKTFSTQCPVCPLSLLPSSLSWVFSYRVWWRVLVSCRFQSSCVCPVSPSCILSPGGTTSECVLRDEAWLHLLVHKLTN